MQSFAEMGIDEHAVIRECYLLVAKTVLANQGYHDHNCDSSHEQIHRCLTFFDAKGAKDHIYKPSRDIETIASDIPTRPLSELPLVEDMLDVVITMTGFYGGLDIHAGRQVAASNEISALLNTLELVSRRGLSTDRLCLYHMDKWSYFAGGHEGAFDSPAEIDDLIGQVALDALDNMPVDDRAYAVSVFEGKRKADVGSTLVNWRFGVWLNKAERSRMHLSPNSNGALSWLIAERMKGAYNTARFA